MKDVSRDLKSALFEMTKNKTGLNEDGKTKWCEDGMEEAERCLYVEPLPSSLFYLPAAFK